MVLVKAFYAYPLLHIMALYDSLKAEMLRTPILIGEGMHLGPSPFCKENRHPHFIGKQT